MKSAVHSPTRNETSDSTCHNLEDNDSNGFKDSSSSNSYDSNSSNLDAVEENEISKLPLSESETDHGGSDIKAESRETIHHEHESLQNFLNNFHPDTFYDQKRIPAYTDRVLYKSLPGFKKNLKEVAFNSCEECVSSDHKPVVCTFELMTVTLQEHHKHHEKDKDKDKHSRYQRQDSHSNADHHDSHSHTKDHGHYPNIHSSNSIIRYCADILYVLRVHYQCVSVYILSMNDVCCSSVLALLTCGMLSILLWL